MANALIFWIPIVLVVLYLFLTKNYKYWQKRNVPHVSGAIPGIGNYWDFIAMKTSFSECIRKFYNDNRGHSMVGIYKFMSPTLMVLEPELVKTVLQTNFTNFHKNGLKVNPDLEPLLANNPFFTYGENWTIRRKRLAYAFSSMRLKILLESIKQVCEKFTDFLNRRLSKVGKVEMELKELFSRYTAQVVTGAGFGVDGLCFDDEKQHESFYTIGKSFLEPTTLNSIIFALVFFIPSLGKILRLRFLPKKADRFFRDMVTDVLNQRKIDGIPRNDFLQLMSDLEKIEGDKFDMDVLTSYAVSLFIDGFETSSIVLSFIGFQLANNQEVQEKLRKEVISVLNKYDGEITYGALNEMTYMDQVINECQRVTPALGFMTKVCTEEIELKGSDGLVCRVEPGMNIMISIQGLQNDPRYWENPDVFDPGRFNPDKKQDIEKFTFLPFSDGPRICVGMRMALLQIKACLATFLKNFSLELSPKTQVPLKMASSSFLNAAEGGLWVFIRPI